MRVVELLGAEQRQSYLIGEWVIKRAFDVIASGVGLILAAPLLVPALVAVWWQDRHSPFYIAPRVGKDGRAFRMIKIRSMIINADKSGVDSTSSSDRRITKVGHFIRRYKLDEISQLINVFLGDMSLVGPRPNVERETDLYTDVEKRLLTVKPGITDISSIVFADEGEILKDSADPDLDYNRLIRPWKSRLGLLYIEKQSFWLDVKLILLTAQAIVSRSKALEGIHRLLTQIADDEQLVHVCRRKEPLVPFPPPGAQEVVSARAA